MHPPGYHDPTGPAPGGDRLDPWGRTLAPPAEPAAVPLLPPLLPPLPPLLAPSWSMGRPVQLPPVGAVAPAARVVASSTSPTWTLVDVFAGLGVTLLLSTLLITTVGFTGFSGGPGLILVAVTPVWLALAGTTVWACRRHGTGNLVTDLGLRLRWSDLLVGLGVALGLRIGLAVWANVVVLVTRELPQDTSNLPDVGAGPPLGSGAWLVVNAVAIALISPFVEELFFRGLGLRSALISLWRRTGSRHLGKPAKHRNQAAWISGLLFGLLHMSEVTTFVEALILVPGLIVAGWVMARLTLWRQRLGPAIVTHVGFNATAVIALISIG